MNIGTSYIDTQFIKECGEKSINFNTLTPIGTQKKIWPQILTIVLLFPTIIFGAIGYGEPTKKSKKKPLSKTTKTICRIIFWMSIISLISMAGLSTYDFIIYLIEYNSWYNSLSGQCRNDLFAINSLKSALNSTRIQ
tara:strand:- start:4474 stop:4884 length:411 start_codon:yes stop_codon:yes gene_type:complete